MMSFLSNSSSEKAAVGTGVKKLVPFHLVLQSFIWTFLLSTSKSKSKPTLPLPLLILKDNAVNIVTHLLQKTYKYRGVVGIGSISDELLDVVQSVGVGATFLGVVIIVLLLLSSSTGKKSDGGRLPSSLVTAKKTKKWNYHRSRFLRLILILVLSSPACTRAEGGDGSSSGGGGDVAPFASISDDFKTLNELSRNSYLRGSDPSDTITNVKNIVQRHLQSIEAMQKMYQNGDNDGLTSVVESLLSDKETLMLAFTQMKEISGEDPFNGQVIPIDSIVEEMKVRGGDDKFQFDLIEAFEDSAFHSLVEETKHISGMLNDIIENFSHLSPSQSHRRMTNLFDQGGSDNGNRGSGGSSFSKTSFSKKPKKQFSPFSSYGQRMKNALKHQKGRGKALPHFHHALHGDPEERRLRVNERNNRRRLEAEQCRLSCQPGDVTCTCERLYSCLKDISTYDLAVLTLGGYIVADGIDYGNLTSDDVDLFDLGDGGLYKKYNIFKTRASQADPQDQNECTKVLEEMHSSCPSITDSEQQSCSSTNDQAYQLSVDEVCDAVDTNIKLNLQSMFDVFSNKPNCLKITTDTKRYSNGYLIVYVDSGYGYEKVADSSFTFGEVVVDKCYAAMVGVRVTQGQDTGAWIGNIELSNDGGKSYNYMKCTDGCTCGPDGCYPVMPVAVDGNSDAVGVADVFCLGSSNKNCTFAPERRDPEKRECIRITADTCDRYCNDMPLQVSIDQGTGDYQVIAKSIYSIGEVVVEQCYAAIFGIKVMNHISGSNKAFIGHFEYSNDSGDTYKPMKCTDCSKCNSSCNKNPMAVDGNADATGVAEMYCHNSRSKPCHLVPDLDVLGPGFFATGGSNCVRWTTGNDDGDNGHFKFEYESAGSWKSFPSNPPTGDHHYFKGVIAEKCTTDKITNVKMTGVGPFTGKGVMSYADYDATTKQKVFYPLYCGGCGCKSSATSSTVDYSNDECKKNALAPIELGVITDGWKTSALIACKKSEGCKFDFTKRIVFAIEEKGQYCTSPSFTACADFVRLFSELYRYRDESEYPRGNPLAPPGLATGTPLVSDTCLKTWETEDLKGVCVDADSVEKYSVRCCKGSKESGDLQCSSGSCEYATSFEQAKSICNSKGMRLCTKDDIQSKQTDGKYLCCGTGCNFDQYNSWTLETCDNVLEDIDSPKFLLNLAIFFKGFEFDQSEHGVNTIESKIGNSYKVYNGCDSSFKGKCVDGLGRHYAYIRSKNNVEEFLECESFCSTLPNFENQVGLETADNKKCYCLYNEGDVPLGKDIPSGIEYELYAWNEETDGRGPVSRGDDKAGFQCYLSAAQTYKSARETAATCDTTMSMLMGQFTSIGDLAGIVKEVRDKGTDYMPGRCCLDKPTTTSDHFGKGYDPSRMDCVNKGDFYLRISREACENVGGIWNRSPCLTLRDCIDARPKEKEDEGFSESFEAFAQNLIIYDPADEEQCENTRRGLGYDENYPYDTEVCDQFNKYLCDPFFDEVDDDRGEDARFESIKYVPPEYPPDPQLKVTPLPDAPTLTKVDTEADGEQKTSKDRLELSKTYLHYNVGMFRVMKQMQDKTMDAVCNQGHWIIQLPCWISLIILYPLQSLGVYALLIATEATTLAYIAVKNGLVNYGKVNYLNGVKENKWAYDSMNIVNQNLQYVNTQLMEVLQGRHTSMETNINTYTMCSTNYLGTQLILAIDPGADVDSLSGECKRLLGVSRRLEEVEDDIVNEIAGPRLDYNMTVLSWGKNNSKALMNSVSNLVAKAKNITVSIKETVERIEDKVVRIEEKLEEEFPSKVGKADKESDEADGEEDTERNRLLEMENLSEKFDWMEKYVKDMDKRMNDKLDNLDKRMNDKIDKLIGVVSKVLEIEGGKEEEEETTS